MLVFGALICTLVVLRLAFSIKAAVEQRQLFRRQGHLRLQLLERQIDTAAALCRQREQKQLHWEGYRNFRVRQKVLEADNICSFYLVPHDKRPLPLFLPGQFLTFCVDVPGSEEPLVRCYSLSNRPRSDEYRVTIKRVPPPSDRPDAPAGLVSNHFHDNVNEGDILKVRSPRGPFTLNPLDTRSAVLIGGGVGITPLLSMVNAALEEASSQLDIRLFYGVRNGHEHAMKAHLRELAGRHGNFHLTVCYSAAGADDVEGTDYDVRGRVTTDLLKEAIDARDNYDFYVCGPPAMMKSIGDGLKEWGVKPECLRTEAFGSATINAALAPPDLEDGSQPVAARPKFQVAFVKSGELLEWDPAAPNLLAFGKNHDIRLKSGCRAGSCGECEVPLKSGSVIYVSEPTYECEEGSCLTCVSVPADNLELDA